MGNYSEWEEFRTGFLMNAYTTEFNDCYNSKFTRLDKALDQESKVHEYLNLLDNLKARQNLIKGWRNYISDKMYNLLKSFTVDGYSGDYELYLEYSNCLKKLDDDSEAFKNQLN
ncbi:MAG: hypothetical protein P8M12_08760 [Flavobacteriales bacterium]|jgi:hypothetical protein|nr:hypothetical protein [Flavobacteriales bacterium]